MIRILVTGSRDWTDRERLELQLRSFYASLVYIVDGYATFLERRLILVHGDCPTGADRMADQLWETLGLEVERHPADWNKYGRRAGFVRNAEMVKLGADICFAFIKNGSKGASMTADLAEKSGIPTVRLIDND